MFHGAWQLERIQIGALHLFCRIYVLYILILCTSVCERMWHTSIITLTIYYMSPFIYGVYQAQVYVADEDTLKDVLWIMEAEM